VVPLAWFLRSRVLLFFALLVLLGVLLLAAIPLADDLVIPGAFFASGFYILAGLRMGDTAFPQSASVWKLAGFAGYLALLYVFSFPGALGLLADLKLGLDVASAYVFVPLGLAALVWVWQMAVGVWRIEALWRWHWGLVSVSLALAAGISLDLVSLRGWAGALPFNLIFLAHCVLFILQGSREANAKLVSVACLLFALLVLARYTDLFHSLLLRSAVFLSLGLGLFAVGNLYARAKGAGARP
jgi:hypothetical protein